MVIGCGSIGAPVAFSLAQAGVGHLVLVDFDELSWPNVGRHPLGATAIGKNKATALADRLQADYPHLVIESQPYGMSALLQADTEMVAEADLVVSATGKLRRFVNVYVNDDDARFEQGLETATPDGAGSRSFPPSRAVTEFRPKVRGVTWIAPSAREAEGAIL